MRVEATQIRGFRLRAHHLDRAGMSEDLQAVAGACGLQNSPPGAWETAAFNRSHCTLAQLHDALYRQKSLLQAWSYRGVPVVFPTRESAVFLSALIARPDERDGGCADVLPQGEADSGDRQLDAVINLIIIVGVHAETHGHPLGWGPPSFALLQRLEGAVRFWIAEILAAQQAFQIDVDLPGREAHGAGVGLAETALAADHGVLHGRIRERFLRAFGVGQLPHDQMGL